MESTLWLEGRLAKYKRILVVISHSQDFLNEVCTNIIHIQMGRLVNYKGNYDTYVKARYDREEEQTRKCASCPRPAPEEPATAQPAPAPLAPPRPPVRCSPQARARPAPAAASPRRRGPRLELYLCCAMLLWLGTTGSRSRSAT